MSLNSALPRLSANQIYSNTAGGLTNATPDLMADARWTWWGSASGPGNSTLNPGGLGNAVSAGVAFIPG
jgi:hypothetical protein